MKLALLATILSFLLSLRRGDELDLLQRMVLGKLMDLIVMSPLPLAMLFQNSTWQVILPTISEFFRLVLSRSFLVIYN
jgi:hypothetical protein